MPSPYGSNGNARRGSRSPVRPSGGSSNGGVPSQLTRQQEDLMAKQRERNARQASTRVHDLASKINDGGPRPGAQSVGPNSPVRPGGSRAAAQVPAQLTRHQEDLLIKQREKDARQTSSRVADLASKINDSASVSTSSMQTQLGSIGEQEPSSSSSSPWQKSVKTNNNRGTVPVTNRQEEMQRNSRRTSTRVQNLASKINDTPNPRSPGPQVVAGSTTTSAAPKKLTQQYQDALMKQREKEARGMSTSSQQAAPRGRVSVSQVPNLASKLSPTGPSSRATVGAGPPSFPGGPTPLTSAAPPKRMTQQEQDFLAKEREKQARRASSAVPGLASKLSPQNGGGRPTVPMPSGMPGAPLSVAQKPAVPKKMTQAEQDALTKQREAAGRRASTAVPGLASKLSPAGQMNRPAVKSAPGMPGAPKMAAAPVPKKMTQAEQDALTKQREAAGRRASTAVPGLASKLSPAGQMNRPTVKSAPGMPGAPKMATASVPVPKKMTQAEQDALTKQREAAGRRASTEVPGLAGKLSPHGASGKTKAAMPKAPPPLSEQVEPISQEEKDELIKQQEKQAREGGNRRSSTILPQLSRYVTAASSQSASMHSLQSEPSNQNDHTSSLQARYHAAGLALGIEDGEELMMQGDIYGTHHNQEDVYYEEDLAQEEAPPVVEQESEDAVRARYRAAAVAMGGGTQEDEDMQIKAREREAAAAANVQPMPKRPGASQAGGGRRQSNESRADADAMAKNQARRSRYSDEGLTPLRTSDRSSSLSKDVGEDSGSGPMSTRDAQAKSRGRRQRRSIAEENSDVVAGEADPAAAAQQVVVPGAFACNMGEREQRAKPVLPAHPVVEPAPEPILVTQEIKPRLAESDEDEETAAGMTTMADAPDEETGADEATRAGTRVEGEEEDDEQTRETSGVERFQEQPKKDEEASPRRKWLYIVAVLLVLGIAGGVGGALAAGGSSPGPTDEGTEAPTATPLPPEPAEVVAAREILSGVVSSASLLTNPSSAQSRALTWIATQDGLSSLPNGGILEGQPTKFLIRYVLAVFYYSLGGPDWQGSSGWLDRDTDECGWERVQCNPDGVVVGILEENDSSFDGVLPSELRHLQGLDYIRIENNRISGVAGSLGESLRVLALEGNDIEGTLPEGIYEMTSLTTLDLGSNHLIGSIETSIGGLTALRELILRDNEFTGVITTEFHSLVNLELLVLTLNTFQGDINQVVEGLPALRHIDLRENRFSGRIQPGLEQLTNLQRYEVSSNSITGPFPNFFANAAGLLALDVGINQITGTIGTEIGSLALLERLIVRKNDIEGSIPSEIGMLAKVRDLIMEFNFLDGTIPTELGDLRSLVTLSLQQTLLVGPIPTEIGELRNLKNLLLESTFITGTLPTEIGRLDDLESLRVGPSSLAGAVPASVCALPRLREIVITATDMSCDCEKCIN